MNSATISTVFERFGGKVKKRYKLSKEQHKVLNLIGLCRTEKLGAHKEQCSSCGHQKIHYNSCDERSELRRLGAVHQRTSLTLPKLSRRE